MELPGHAALLWRKQWAHIRVSCGLFRRGAACRGEPPRVSRRLVGL